MICHCYIADRVYVFTFSGVLCKDDCRPGGAGDWSGKSVARDGAAPGPPVLGLRPLLGHSSAFQATTGPSGGQPRSKAGHMADLESRLETPAGREKAAAYLEFEDFSHTGLGLETYEDGLQHPIELRRILTGDLRYLSEILFLIWFLSSHLSPSMRPTSISAWRCRSPSKPVQTMSFRPSTTRQKRRKGFVQYLLHLSLHPQKHDQDQQTAV